MGPNRLFLQKMENSGRIQTILGYFNKQPYGDLAISYVTKEKKFSDIVTIEEELASIQGSWRSYNKQAIYIFSEDKFTVNARGRKSVNGTVKIKDNILYLIVSDEKFGILHIYILPDNRIFLIDIWSYSDLWWGLFIKQ